MFHREDAAGRQFLDTGFIADVKEAEERTLLAMLGDEGAAALLALDEILRRHLVERLAHRSLADAELDGEPPLAGQRIAGPPVAAQHAANHQILDLRIEGTKIGSVERRGFAVVGHAPHSPAIDHSYIRHKNSVDKGMLRFQPFAPRKSPKRRSDDHPLHRP